MDEKPAPKPIYAAVPARVIGAENLTAIDLRVLMVIAVHDRLGANGIGCYASHTRLAELVGCHLKSLSRSLRNLAGFGYISAGPHPLNGRLRVYRVVYSQFDAAFIKSIGNKPATYEEATANGLVPISAAIGNQFVPQNGPIGNQLFENTQSDQRDAEVNILGETLIHPGEPVLIHPVETASLPLRKQGALEDVGSRSVSAMLAMIERRMKDGKYDPDWTLRYLDSLVGLDAALGIDDPHHGWAQRLLERMEAAA
jgi:hypothetical protein